MLSQLHVVIIQFVSMKKCRMHLLYRFFPTHVVVPLLLINLWQILPWGRLMTVLVKYTCTTAHQMASTRSQCRWGNEKVTSSNLWLNIIFILSYFNLLRYSHQDPIKSLCLDILCRVTWTWITISTQTWLWDRCLILSLSSGNLTARTLGDKAKIVLVKKKKSLSFKMFFYTSCRYIADDSKMESIQPNIDQI